MNKKYIYFTALLFLLLSSCDNGKKKLTNSQKNISSFDVKNIEWRQKKDFSIKDIVRQVEYIKLEDNENSMFTSIDKMIIKDDRIYILDITGSHKLLVFDKSGAFLHKVGSQGGGPGEYSRSMLNFCVGEHTDEVILFDYAKKTMLFYDSDGNFIKSEKTNFSFNDFMKIKDNNYLVSLDIFEESNNYNKVVVTRDLKENNKSYFKFDKDYKNDKLNVRSFQSNNDLISYMTPVSDTLYVFNNDGGIINGYYFDFKDRKLSKDLKNSYEEVVKSRRMGIHYTYIYETPIIIKNYIVASMFMGGQKCISVFNTNNSELTHEILNPETFDINNIYFPLCTIGDSILVSYIDSNIYGGIEDKLSISTELDNHLKLGGAILCLYSIK